MFPSSQLWEYKRGMTRRFHRRVRRPDAVIYCFQPGMSSAETTLSEDRGFESSSEQEESPTVIGDVVIVC